MEFAAGCPAHIFLDEASKGDVLKNSRSNSGGVGRGGLQADAAQRALMHEAGDLATILRLWDRWQEAETNSRRERLCRELYLGRRRMREWSDVRHQLWGALRERRKNLAEPHQPGAWPLDRLHRCVLAGMLGNVLLWDAKLGSYRGAGNRELAVHPGSALRARDNREPRTANREPPRPWLVACELVETSRLFARLCAPIDPAWVVELAGDRLRASHREPRWDARRAQVVVTETLLWKGLPVRDGRAVPFGAIDPAAATRIFLREALCGEEPLGVPAIDANRAVLRRAQGLRDRLRDPGLAAEPEHLESWYAQRFGAAPLSTTAELRTWIAAHGEPRLTLDDLLPPGTAARADACPDAVAVGGRRTPLAYRYAPGSPDDGVTLELSEEQAAQLTLAALDGLVPGWLPDLFLACLEQLPKESRRALIPLADTARAAAAALAPLCGRADLATALAGWLGERHGVSGARFDRRLLPEWLRPRVLVRGAAGLTWQGRDPEFLAQQAEAAPDRLALLKAEWETPPDAAWPGDCPAETQLAGVRGHVALERSRARDGGVAARRAVHASPEAAAAWHRDGLEALLEAALAPDLADWVGAPAPAALSARCEKALGLSLGAARSEERRVGKECRSRWSPYH